MTLAAVALAALSFLQVVPNAIATFEGILKADNGKFIEVQVESGETMRMYRTRGTKFIKDGKPVKPSAFHEGDKVIVDAERDVRMNLLAVKIEAPKADAPKPK
jgi:hypothetical protein